MMTEEQKLSIIDSGKEYFRNIIIPQHIKNLKKLKLNSFKINPFTVSYIASFLCGNTKPESLAKALVYPRVLGTSINTSFGTHAQFFISKVSEITGSASGIEGIDIEFIDALDGRRKYCQCKAGPNCINKDDKKTIEDHFKYLLNKALRDKLPLQVDDLVVGVLYGEIKELNTHYKDLSNTYSVFCGAEFWRHLTGDNSFYYRLAKAFGEVVEEEKINGSTLIKQRIDFIAKEIESKGGRIV